MLYRLFAALPVPADIGEALQEISKGVTGASWRPIENFHITLRYFGEIDAMTANDLDHELGLIEGRQMQLRLKGADWFGGADPHAIWAGVEPDETLTRLSSACERAARRIGLPRERRSFKPHVTLAYCHGTSMEDAMSFGRKHAQLSLGPFWVDRWHLYSSWSGKGPSRYVAEAEYPLH